MKLRFAIMVILGAWILIGADRYSHRANERRTGMSVTRLLSPDGHASGGTGFEIEWHGRQYTLTNDHVCGLAEGTGYLLAVPTYGRVQTIRVLKRSDRTDLCLLEPLIDLPALKPSATILRNLEGFTVVGHPLLDKLTATSGHIVRFETIKLLEGVITNKEQEDACHGPKRTPGDFLIWRVCVVTIRSQQTTAHIEPGSSGSPVVDSYGEVKGIAFASDSIGHHSYIVPVDDIRKFLNSYDKAPKHPRMSQVR